MFRLTKVQFFFVLIFSTLLSHAQIISNKESESKEQSDSADFKEKIFFEGNFNAAFYTYSYIEISPIIGYRFNKNLSGGIGPVYCGFDFFKGNAYGGRGMARLFLFDDFFINAELQMLSLQKKYFDRINNYPEHGRFLDENIFIGIGYKYPIYGYSYSYFVIMYNLDHDSNSFYDSPIVTGIGLNF